MMVAELSFGVHRWLSCCYVTLTILSYRCEMRMFNLESCRTGKLIILRQRNVFTVKGCWLMMVCDELSRHWYKQHSETRKMVFLKPFELNNLFRVSALMWFINKDYFWLLEFSRVWWARSINSSNGATAAALPRIREATSSLVPSCSKGEIFLLSPELSWLGVWKFGSTSKAFYLHSEMALATLCAFI